MRQDGSDDGLRPPPEHAWQIGKTAATIRFVHDANAFIEYGGPLSPQESRLLHATIERMKNGQEVLNDFETVEQWLERLRDHHP